MSSLRRRLFLILLTATGLIWLSAVAWIGLVSRSELEHVLDTRLQEAARMVHSLVMAGDGAAAAFPETEPALAGSYERQLSCQVWSFDGRLIARSSGAPASEMASDREGFADREVNGETWRVYTIVDAQKGIRVVVGDRVGLRDRLVLDLIAGLAVPAVLVLPLLGLLIWWSLGQGLRPLRRVAADIAARDGDDDILLRGEVPVDLADLDPARAGDLRDAGSVEAVFDEQAAGSFEDMLTAAGGA